MCKQSISFFFACTQRLVDVVYRCVTAIACTFPDGSIEKVKQKDTRQKKRQTEKEKAKDKESDRQGKKGKNRNTNAKTTPICKPF